MPDSPDRAPAIETVVETAVYVADLDRAEAFYRDVLGLAMLGKEEGRHVFFGVGDGVLLVFNPQTTLEGGALPAHGATGPSCHRSRKKPSGERQCRKQATLSGEN